MERLYGGFLCSMCDQPGRFGFVYVCTQDWEGERLEREGTNQALNSAIERTITRSTRPSSEMDDDSAPFPVEDLNQSTKDAIARGGYTDEQIEILKAQKRHVVDVTRECLERIKEEESQPFRSLRTFGPTTSPFLTRPVMTYEANFDPSLPTSDSSSSSSSEEADSATTTPVTSSNSAVQDVDSTKPSPSTTPVLPPLAPLDGIVQDLFDVRVGGSKKRKTPPSPTVLTTGQGALDSDGRAPRIFPYCTFMCCPACRPTYRDRVWGRLDAYLVPSTSHLHPSPSVQHLDSAQPNTDCSDAGVDVKEPSHSEHSLALSLSKLGSDPFGPRLIPVDLVRNIGLRKPPHIPHGHQDEENHIFEPETPELGIDVSEWDTAAMIRGDENDLPEHSPPPSSTHAGQTEVSRGTDPALLPAEKQGSVARRSVVRESIRRKVREWIDRRDSTRSVSSSTFAAAAATRSDQRTPSAGAGVVTANDKSATTTMLMQEKSSADEEIDLGTDGLAPAPSPSSSPLTRRPPGQAAQVEGEEKAEQKETVFEKEVDIVDAERSTTPDEREDAVPVGVEITEEAAEMKAPDLVVRI